MVCMQRSEKNLAGHCKVGERDLGGYEISGEAEHGASAIGLREAAGQLMHDGWPTKLGEGAATNAVKNVEMQSKDYRALFKAPDCVLLHIERRFIPPSNAHWPLPQIIPRRADSDEAQPHRQPLPSMPPNRLARPTSHRLPESAKQSR